MTRWRALLLTALVSAVLVLAAAPGRPARAEEAKTWIEVSADTVLPGQPVIVSFFVPEDGMCDIDLLDENGALLAKVVENRAVTAGYNAFYWNGTSQGWAVSEGERTLRLMMNGVSAETAVTIGKMTPTLLSALSLK